MGSGIFAGRHPQVTVKAALSLKWQAVLIALGALLVSHFIAIIVYTLDRDDAISNAAIADLAGNISSYVAISENLDRESRFSNLKLAEGRSISVTSGASEVDPACNSNYDINAEVDRIIASVVSPEIEWTSCVSEFSLPGAKRLAQPAYSDPGNQTLRIAFTFPDGEGVTFIGKIRNDPLFVVDKALAIIVLAGLAAGGGAYWLILRVTGPLSRLSQHAEEVGRNLDSPQLPESGPLEVRSVARAFNQMHKQLKRLVDGRTEMLGAISHDLRTPIGRMKLRTELLPDSPERTKLMRTIEEMENMTNAVLAFIRGAAPHEAQRDIDLSSFLDSICSDLADANLPVIFFDDQQTIRYSCRPAALRRAVENLIDNAVKYGGSAEVRLHRDNGQLTIEVADRGPGLDMQQIEKVTAPFYRAENSRNRETGGHGLGLSIAASIANAHGGELVIRNRDSGGLIVSLILPG